MSWLDKAIEGGTTLTNTMLQNYYNRKSASRSQDYAWSMWNAENEYNKPVNQMARLEEAGLNPNLIYGNGSASTGNASLGSSATVTPPNVKLASYLGLENMELQNALLDEQGKVAKLDRETYENTGIRPDSSFIGQLARLYSTKNGKAVLANLWNDVKEVFTPKSKKETQPAFYEQYNKALKETARRNVNQMNKLEQGRRLYQMRNSMKKNLDSYSDV